MPLPVKRYVEPSDSSVSSSDDEASSPISQDTSQLTDDSQLEVSVVVTVRQWLLLISVVFRHPLDIQHIANMWQ